MGKVSRARSLVAFIMREFGTGRVFLRVKTGPHPDHYRDCSLAHADLKVMILDDDAFIYRDKDKDGKDYAVIDYSTETITGGSKPPKETKSKRPKKPLLDFFDLGKEPSHKQGGQQMAATKRTTATKKPATKRTVARKGAAKATSRTTKNRR